MSGGLQGEGVERWMRWMVNHSCGGLGHVEIAFLSLRTFGRASG